MDRMSSCGVRPVKVYRTWWSVAMMSLPPVGLAAVFLYALFKVDVQWWFWVLMLSMVAGLLYMSVTWLRHVGDRIEVFDRGLHLTWAERRREGGKWVAVGDVWLEWRDIKAFSKTSETNIIPLYTRRWIWLHARDGIVYRITPDLYDTFFLERKLREYRATFGHSRSS